LRLQLFLWTPFSPPTGTPYVLSKVLLVLLPPGPFPHRLRKFHVIGFGLPCSSSGLYRGSVFALSFGFKWWHPIQVVFIEAFCPSPPKSFAWGLPSLFGTMVRGSDPSPHAFFSPKIPVRLRLAAVLPRELKIPRSAATYTFFFVCQGGLGFLVFFSCFNWIYFAAPFPGVFPPFPQAEPPTLEEQPPFFRPGTAAEIYMQSRPDPIFENPPASFLPRKRIALDGLKRLIVSQLNDESHYLRTSVPRFPST